MAPIPTVTRPETGSPWTSRLPSPASQRDKQKTQRHSKPTDRLLLTFKGIYEPQKDLVQRLWWCIDFSCNASSKLTNVRRQGKFICRAQFVHKAIQSALQLYKIRRRQIKSFHKYKKLIKLKVKSADKILSVVICTAK